MGSGPSASKPSAPTLTRATWLRKTSYCAAASKKSAKSTSLNPHVWVHGAHPCSVSRSASFHHEQRTLKTHRGECRAEKRSAFRHRLPMRDKSNPVRETTCVPASVISDRKRMSVIPPRREHL